MTKEFLLHKDKEKICRTFWHIWLPHTGERLSAKRAFILPMLAENDDILRWLNP